MTIEYGKKTTIMKKDNKSRNPKKIKIYRILTKTPFEENAKDIYEYCVGLN